jgi:predicted TIM-barrel fold metal-dependent hydrolase
MFPAVTLEEHYVSPSIGQSNAQLYDAFSHQICDKLRDLGAERLANMDAGGVSLQIITHGPGVGGVEQCRAANDYLAAAVARNPSRFAGFATLPMGEPREAALELERCVREHRFVGALVENHYEGRYYDAEFFWPVFEMSEKLETALYIHPSFPEGDLVSYYKGNYDKDAELALGSFGLGWHVDTGLHVLRLFAAGIFDRFPRLQVVIGHMGELLPYQLERILRVEGRGVFGKRKRGLREVWDNSISITTSGMFSLSPMACMLRNTKVERILYSVDYPFSSNQDGLKFLEELRASGLVTEDQLECIAYKNAERLLKVRASQGP